MDYVAFVVGVDARLYFVDVWSAVDDVEWAMAGLTAAKEEAVNLWYKTLVSHDSETRKSGVNVDDFRQKVVTL